MGWEPRYLCWRVGSEGTFAGGLIVKVPLLVGWEPRYVPLLEGWERRYLCRWVESEGTFAGGLGA